MKDSGIEWIGKIPKEWKVCRLKNLCTGLSNGTAVQQTSRGVTNYPVTRIETISLGEINYYKVGYIKYFDGIEKYKLADNDILISNINSFAHVGKCALYKKAGHDLYHGMNLIKISPTKITYPYFLLLFLKSDAFINQMQSLCKPAINQVSVSASSIKQINITKPSYAEQQHIATFLDKKCEDIDTLITLQEEMITELQAYKQSVISEAVTKGLNPNVTMKDSGVEWIGEIPNGWNTTKMKYIVNLKSGTNLTSYQISDNGKYPVYGGNGLRGFYQNYSNEGNYVLVGRQGALCGNINYTNGKFWVTEHALVCYPRCKFVVKWLGELLRAMNLNQYSLSAAQPGLSAERIMNLYLPIPPLPEQQAIADYLDTKCAQIDQLIALKQEKITELQDYKKSLIYEYVTGKKEVPATN